MAKSICPSCLKPEGVPLIWGFPNPEDFELEERKEIVLAGCVIDSNDDHACLACEHRWDSSSPQNKQTNLNPRPAQQPIKPRTARNGRNSVSVNISASTSNVGEPSIPVRQRKSVSLIPTAIFFFCVLILSMTVAGGTFCADGWDSGSLGRSGACSHHGGVNNLPQSLAFMFSVILSIAFHIYRLNRVNKHKE